MTLLWALITQEPIVQLVLHSHNSWLAGTSLFHYLCFVTMCCVGCCLVGCRTISEIRYKPSIWWYIHMSFHSKCLTYYVLFKVPNSAFHPQMDITLILAITLHSTNVPTSILTTKDVPHLLSGTARDRSVTGARLCSADRQVWSDRRCDRRA